ncbi:MAG: S8 family serine peptidase [Chlorobi bacterium]|nr:S8 family serine peptidase [Chlorobiota bacterium]MCI0716607.1 S8 family serine peptidase [Chlorobiota bacterium]
MRKSEVAMYYLKISLSIVTLFFFVLTLKAEKNYFYYYYNEKLTLQPDYSEFNIKLNNSTINRNFNAIFEDSEIQQIENSVFKVKTKNKELYNLLSRFEGVISYYPVLYRGASNYVLTDNTLICLPKNGISIEDIIQELIEYNPNVEEIFNVGYAEKYLISINYEYNVIDVANQLYESELVEFAHPNFDNILEIDEPFGTGEILDAESDCLDDPYFEPNDQYYWGKQWYLKRCEAARVPYAWYITQGSQYVIVAILDMGFDLPHPEFTGKYLGQYNAIDNNYNVVANCYETHGTRVAGVLGALSNNGNGIASIGFNTKFLPIRIISVDLNYPHNQHLKESDLVRAEQYLINNYLNTNVVAINCSWRIQQTSNVESVLQNLRNNMRGGKGTSMVFCSGNEGSNNIWYPASSQYTIAVGGTYLYVTGIIPHSEQKKWPSANYGAGLDLVAPSWHMFTTDVRSSFNCSFPGNYTFDYGPDGTSFAAPLVCGAIALMAAINPDLTRAQYETILLTHTNKFGGYNYNEYHQFGTWNYEVGYGVLDVNACVRNVYPQNLCLNGPAQYMGTYTFQATNDLQASCNGSLIEVIGNITFEAGNSVILTPPFTVLQNATFTAKIVTMDNPITNYDFTSIPFKNSSTYLSDGKMLESNNKPLEFSLLQNYPNPFNPSTLMRYALKENTYVKITIYDILGRVIKTLVNEYQDAGYKFVTWDGTNNQGSNVSTGVYVYKIEAGNFVDSKKMVLLK